jgi:putative intracellular protease/amidase
MNQYILLCAILRVFLSFCLAGPAMAATTSAAAGADRERITKTLTDYMEGTANGEPDKLKKAFHPDFKLYAVTEGSELLIRSGQQYIADIKSGEKIKRIGRIVSIDVENNAATAKVEILTPNFRLYTDYFLLLKYAGSWKIVQKSYTSKAVPKQQNRILFVTSNQHTYGNTKISAANHFEEIVIAYDVFRKNGYAVDFVSPDGGAIPVGYVDTSNPTQKEHLYDSSFMALLKNTLKPEQINASEYQAVYYSGGGAAMFGVAENKIIQNIAGTIYENGGVVSAVCHGTAGIVNLKSRDGAFIFANKKVTGFPDIFEDTKAEYYQAFPFSIDKEVSKNGGNFVYSKNWGDNFFIVDGNIITGQDPTATASVAQEVIKNLQRYN